MYKSIYAYALRTGKTVEKHMQTRKIAAYIHLETDGTYKMLQTFPAKEIPRKMCPKKLPGGNDSPCPMVDKVAKYFVMNEKDQRKHDLYMQAMEEAAKYSSAAKTVYAFLKKAEEDTDIKNKVWKDIEDQNIKPESYVSWKIDGCAIEDDTSWREWLSAKMATPGTIKNGSGLSVISGKEYTYNDVSYPWITEGPVGTGFPVFSNQQRNFSGNNCAFKSYGANDAYAAGMISKEEAETIKAGIESLLTSDHNHSTNYQILYWYDGETKLDVMRGLDPLNNENPKKRGKTEEEINPVVAGECEEAWMTLLNATIKKQENSLIENDEIHLHIIEYDIPSKGRFVLHNERIVPYMDACRNLQQWYNDSRLVTAVYDKESNEYKRLTKELNNPYAVLKSTLTHINANDNKIVKKEYGTNVQSFLMAVLGNKQIPKIIYQHALHQAQRSVILKGFPEDEQYKRGKDRMLQIIKVYLIRTEKEENAMSEVLKEDSRNQGYLCGRALAVMDALQRAAQGNVGISISQRYIKLIERKPDLGMKEMLANRDIYLKKLSGTENGSIKAKYFANCLNEVLAGFGDVFPQKLTDEEKGAIYLGRAHQEYNMKLRKKKDQEINTEENTDPADSQPTHD